MLARMSVMEVALVSAALRAAVALLSTALRAGLEALLLLSFLAMATPPTFGCPLEVYFAICEGSPLEVCLTSCEGTGGTIEDWVLIGWCTGADCSW